jgi:ActR/RegA family two-component response regulator
VADMEQVSEGYINTVLIVVNDDLLIEQITGALAVYGFNFITAKSVFEALSNITINCRILSFRILIFLK